MGYNICVTISQTRLQNLTAQVSPPVQSITTQCNILIFNYGGIFCFFFFLFVVVVVVVAKSITVMSE
jgi:hypothetical protein